MTRIHLRAADCVAVAIGGVAGIALALGILESWLRHAAKAGR